MFRGRLARWLIGIIAAIALLFLIVPILALVGRAISTQAWNELPNLRPRTVNCKGARESHEMT